MRYVATHFDKKKIKMRKFGTESTHFEKSFQIDLNMEPTHRSLTFFQSAFRVYISITFYLGFKRTLKIRYVGNKTSGTLF